jgi:Na+/melibiose symporter-like transporter
MLQLLAQTTPPIPISPNATDPASWSVLFRDAGIPAATMVFVLACTFALVVLVIWLTLGPRGFVRKGFNAWVDTQIKSWKDLSSDVATIKRDAEKEGEAHAAQNRAHAATIAAGDHALDALGTIGAKVGADVSIKIELARDKLRASLDG